MRCSTLIFTVLSATTAVNARLLAPGQARLAPGFEAQAPYCAPYLRQFLLESLSAIPTDDEVHVTEQCDNYSGCGFCGFYERCCYKKDGAGSSAKGVCKCGISGREDQCA